jgi:hypothetical protein
MKIVHGIETGKKYFWKRTNGWKWFDGEEHWWEVDVIFDGLNGVGGVWLREQWHWNGDDQVMIDQPRSLGVDESNEIIRLVRHNLQLAGVAP